MRKYKPKEVIKLLNIHYNTLIYWEKIGKLVAHRNDKNRRYYTKRQIDEIRKFL